MIFLNMIRFYLQVLTLPAFSGKTSFLLFFDYFSQLQVLEILIAYASFSTILHSDLECSYEEAGAVFVFDDACLL